MTEILAKEGDTVAVNSVLARLGEAGEVGAGASAAAAAAPARHCSRRSLPAKLSASPGRRRLRKPTEIRGPCRLKSRRRHNRKPRRSLRRKRGPCPQPRRLWRRSGERGRRR